MSSLILGPRWTITNQPGCCGMATISRLNSRYCSESAKKANLASWYAATSPHAIMSDLPKWTTQDMQQILLYSDQRPQGVLWSGRLGYAGWFGGAVPVRIGFIAMLEQMYKHQKHAMYFLSDNTEQQGDVHTGPFSTLRFVQWAFDENLGSFVTSGPVTSLRTQRTIQGWIFTPHWDTISPYITEGRQFLIHSIKGLNNDPRIKEANENRLKEYNVSRAAMRQAFSSNGW